MLRIPNAALRFRPGLAAPGFAERAAGERPGATRKAVTGGPDARTVWAVRGEEPVPVRVRIGLSDGTATELVEGDLRAGDRLVTDAGGGAPAGLAANLRRGMGPPPP